MKQRIRLTENDLHRIVRESVSNTLKEASGFRREKYLTYGENKPVNLDNYKATLDTPIEDLDSVCNLTVAFVNDCKRLGVKTLGDILKTPITAIKNRGCNIHLTAFEFFKLQCEFAHLVK